ncbi:MAG: CRISPR-associated endonuclease Cas2 [Hydrogenobacter thermophilus]|uniref:CRISPR-associated endonuclease Cas2 n=1 Tax=Hydrogenobacter thermophilus TaxID=940 RepID=UPI001C740602|nr:CRISPR-associated endonuclease Cas2 [Hydrogenobacter thermophilus]QWK20613.1 MAG: CRISPR-associated endonuclease Cas2 [Hydrogenobacter thermophilus]
MKYLVAYDISNDTVRAKVSRILLNYGYRIQLSVFYIPEISQAELDVLYLRIRKLVNPKTDRVFFYPVEEIEVFEGYPLQPWEVEIV